MHKRLMDLCVKLLDYVAEHENVQFNIESYAKKERDIFPPLVGEFVFWDKDSRGRSIEARYVARGGQKRWSMQFEITEDNLEYLVRAIGA